MALFNISQPEEYVAYFFVEAESPEEAIERHLNGESTYDDNEFVESRGDATITDCDDPTLWEIPTRNTYRARTRQVEVTQTPPPEPLVKWGDIWRS